MPALPRLRQVALVLPVNVSWGAVLAQGVADYSREHESWDFTTSPPTMAEAEEVALTPYSLKGWAGQGAIAVINDAAEARAARRLGFPVVCVNGNVRNPGLPRVMPDYYVGGQVAAEHLLDRGSQRLAYCGLKGPWYSAERKRGFVDRAKQAKVTCEVFDLPPNTDLRASWQQRRHAVATWLKTLQTPIAILAVHDYRARVLIDECLRLGWDVPLDVAVLGMDNDLTACEFCQPTLSSVARAAWKIGYAAARMLHYLMDGRAAPVMDIRVPPSGVVGRRSTDTITVEDAHVRAAVHFMRDHLHEVFRLERVLEHLDVSRRLLHERFQHWLGHPPYEYLCSLRVERAKQLLSIPNRVKMRKIAAECGFSSAARMRLVFQRTTGMTPLEYHRLQGIVAASKSPQKKTRKAT
ncbi:MAG: XylR family transcriptional regulator [Thermoguttaceae bacterium]